MSRKVDRLAGDSNYTMQYRILDRMKVTALIDDQLVEDVKKLAHGKTITESLVIALREWVATKRLAALSDEIKKNPIEFNLTSSKIRALSRRRRS